MARRRRPRPRREIRPEKYGDSGEDAIAAYGVEFVEGPEGEAILRQLEQESGVRPREERADEKIELSPPGE